MKRKLGQGFETVHLKSAQWEGDAILYPEGKKEQDFRRRMFPEEVFTAHHPAKANIFMVEDIIKSVSDEGETLLDPMGGTGTMIIAATMGRRVIIFDIEDVYHEIQVKAAEKMNVTDKVICILGNAEKVLPIPCNHVIFSPPYADIMKKSASKTESGDWKGDITGDLYGATTEEFGTYSRTKGNVGLLNKFMYSQVMERIYAKLYASVSPGGTVTSIVKDFIMGGQRVFISEQVIRQGLRVGLEVDSWNKKWAGGSPFVKIRRAQGKITVDDEDIITFKRPMK